MGQVTWRASDELVARVKAAAAAESRSLNEFLTQIMIAITDPRTAGTEAARIRERLARADILARTDVVAAAGHGPPSHRTDPEEVARARRAAGQGTQLSDLVADERR